MNTPEFIHNLDNVASVLPKFFDELMVLYNLVGHRQDLEICTDTSNASLVTFTLLMDSEDDAKSLYENLNGSSFSVYDKYYDIHMEISGASVKTTITKATSD